jgi:hypothetical protein
MLTMRRPAGVVVAAVVLGLMAVLAILGTIVSLVASMVIHPPVTIPGFRVIMVVFNLVALGIFGFCGWTVAGLFKMRRWARIAIVVIGGLEFAVCAVAGFGVLAVRHLVPVVPPPPPGMAQPGLDLSAVPMIIEVMAAFYFFLALIGVWWLVYFNLPSVRAAFSGANLMVTNPDILPPGGAVAFPVVADAGTPGWRIVIIVWACLMLFSLLYFPLVLVMHTPFFLFGAIITGSREMLLLALMGVIQLIMGIGLIRKWKAAWYVALFWQIYTIAYSLSMFLPGMDSRFIAYEEQAMARYSPAGAPAFPIGAFFHGPFFVFCFGFGLAIVALFTIALFKRKEDYLGTDSAAV